MWDTSEHHTPHRDLREMFYSLEIEIPPNTPALTPIIKRLGVHPGITQHAWFGFPLGCYGLAHIQVWHGGWQVWPLTQRESFHWNDIVIDFDDRYPIPAEPYEFTIKGWNLDDSYYHTLWFAVTIEHDVTILDTRDLYAVMRELGVLESD